MSPDVKLGVMLIGEVKIHYIDNHRAKWCGGRFSLIIMCTRIFKRKFFLRMMNDFISF